MSLKQNEYEIKKLLHAIEKDMRIRKLDNAQEICRNNVIKVKKLCNVLNEFENENKDIYNKFKENSAKMWTEIKKVIKEINDKQNKLSFAETVKKSMELPDVQKQVPLIKTRLK